MVGARLPSRVLVPILCFFTALTTLFFLSFSDCVEQAEDQGRRADAMSFYGLSGDWDQMGALLERALAERLRVGADKRSFWKVGSFVRIRTGATFQSETGILALSRLLI